MRPLVIPKLNRTEDCVTTAASAVGGLAVVLQTLRTATLPPLGWDSLTYHLPRAAYWVQSGGHAPVPGPGAWGYYDFFPMAGDAIWAWAMVWTKTDVLVAPTSAIVSILLVVGGTLSIAESLKRPRAVAILFALTVLTFPAHGRLIGTAYVDNIVLGCVVAGMAFAIRAMSDPRSYLSWSFCGAAFALGVAIKLTTAPYLALAGLMACVFSIRYRHWQVALAFGIGAMVVVPGLVRTTLYTGSPVYPFAALGFPPHWLIAQQFEKLPVQGSYWAAVKDSIIYLFLSPDGGQRGDAYSGYGVGGLGLFVLGVYGWLRSTRPIKLLGWSAVASAIIFFQLWLPRNQALYDWWMTAFPRHVSIPSVAVWVGVVFVSRRWVHWTLSILVLANVMLLVAEDWPTQLTVLTMYSAGTTIFLSLAVLVIARKTRQTGATLASLVVAVILWVASSQTMRERTRYDMYELVLGTGVSTISNISPLIRANSRWRRLDTTRPLTIAYVTPISLHHVQALYPLFGRRLQNTVLHIENMAQGGWLDGSDPTASVGHLDASSWLCRLRDESVDYVFAYSFVSVPTPEEHWMRSFPDIFIPLDGDVDSRVYAIDRQRINERGMCH